ncbi:MAG: hypothetical protein NTV51_15885, partial [Verrucomicrobia bacterium]|nr:hypothetical protein [Verrucomicrobiota bacterium]
MTASFFSFLPSRARSAHVALALALAFPASLSLQAQGPAANAPRQPPSLNEKVSAEFQKLKPLQDAKNWNGMIALLDGLLPTVGPQSYDLAYIQDMRARLLAQQDQWAASIDTMELSLKVSDANQYFDKNKTLEMLLFLAQVSYQQATTIKVAADQQRYLTKAADYFKRWLKDTPKATPEISAFYATILLQQAVADPKNVNMALIKQAHAEVDKLFLTTLRPKEQLYFLLFSILQQENEIAKAAEVLELIVK